MAHLRRAPGDGIEHLEGRHQFLGAIYFDPEAPAGHFRNQPGQVVGACSQAGKVLGPGGDHFPFDGGTRTGQAAGAYPGGGYGHAGFFQKISAIHWQTSLLFID